MSWLPGGSESVSKGMAIHGKAQCLSQSGQSGSRLCRLLPRHPRTSPHRAASCRAQGAAFCTVRRGCFPQALGKAWPSVWQGPGGVCLTWAAMDVVYLPSCHHVGASPQPEQRQPRTSPWGARPPLCFLHQGCCPPSSHTTPKHAPPLSPLLSEFTHFINPPGVSCPPGSPCLLIHWDSHSSELPRSVLAELLLDSRHLHFSFPPPCVSSSIFFFGK